MGFVGIVGLPVLTHTGSVERCSKIFDPTVDPDPQLFYYSTTPDGLLEKTSCNPSIYFYTTGTDSDPLNRS